VYLQIIRILNVVEVVVVIEDFVVVVIIELHQVYLIGFKILQIPILFNIDRQHLNNDHHGNITIILLCQSYFHFQVLQIPVITIIQVYHRHNNHFQAIILLTVFFLGCNVFTFFFCYKWKKKQ
jgi:ABC-type glycerol-3-phosphate transport system permease component